MPPKPSPPTTGAPSSSRVQRRVNSLTREHVKDLELGRYSERAGSTAGDGKPGAHGDAPAAAADLHSTAAGTLAVAAPKVVPPSERKKAASTVRKVLKFDDQGRTTMLEANKVSITHSLGVQSRDLRLLDPQMATSYPSAILCRDQALVVNCEHIKCIITRHYLLLLNPGDEQVLPFVAELQKKLGSGCRAGEASEAGTEVLTEYTGTSGASDMPFELRVLEVVLDTVAQQLERQASDLESQAHPAMDALTAKVNTENLERVRRIKNRLVRMTTRTETLREVLEKFLDDDSNMKDMNLTGKYEQHIASLQRRSLELHSADQMQHKSTPLSGASPMPFTAWEDDRDNDSDSDVDEVEYMLETYFMQIDNTYNKLQTLMEYIDDAEDYINIELDSHRNQIIQLDLVLTTATTAVSMIAAIGSIFGMNLANNPSGTEDATYTRFILVTVLTVCGAIGFFILVIAMLARRRLIGF